MTGPQSVSLAGSNIHLSFGQHAVLRGVDIEVPAGKTVAVIGPSGSGKSTLLRILNRLYEPDRGDVLLDGRSVLNDDPARLRQRIGMVFQHFNLFPHLSVLDNVMLAPRTLKHLSGDAARESALAQLDRVAMLHSEQPPGRAVRRSAAKGCDRPRAGHGAPGDAVRRSDLRAGS